MRKESEYLIKQAEVDLHNAEKLLKEEAYDLVSFLSHQVAEKALKAVAYEKLKEMPPKTHNLREYAELLNAPLDISLACRDLTPHYITSRYPDAIGGAPFEIYTEETAKNLLKKAKKVLEWSKEKL
ncbi:MAG: HEPN domain-containing protein [Candidatus Anstonellales archaeon]